MLKIRMIGRGADLDVLIWGRADDVGGSAVTAEGVGCFDDFSIANESLLKKKLASWLFRLEGGAEESASPLSSSPKILACEPERATLACPDA
jgi:hypothetical protein